MPTSLPSIDPGITIAIISLVGTLILAILHWRETRGRAKASEGDAAESLSEAARKLIETYPAELERVRLQVTAAQSLATKSQQRVNELELNMEGYLSKIGKLEGEVATLTEKVTERDRRISSQDAEILDLRKRLDEASKENEKLSERVTVLEEDNHRFVEENKRLRGTS